MQPRAVVRVSVRERSRASYTPRVELPLNQPGLSLESPYPRTLPGTRSTMGTGRTPSSTVPPYLGLAEAAALRRVGVFEQRARRLLRRRSSPCARTATARRCSRRRRSTCARSTASTSSRSASSGTSTPACSSRSSRSRRASTTSRRSRDHRACQLLGPLLVALRTAAALRLHRRQQYLRSSVVARPGAWRAVLVEIKERRRSRPPACRSRPSRPRRGFGKNTGDRTPTAATSPSKYPGAAAARAALARRGSAGSRTAVASASRRRSPRKLAWLAGWHGVRASVRATARTSGSGEPEGERREQVCGHQPQLVIHSHRERDPRRVGEVDLLPPPHATLSAAAHRLPH